MEVSWITSTRGLLLRGYTGAHRVWNGTILVVNEVSMVEDTDWCSENFFFFGFELFTHFG